jgi:hypothetical protein
MAQQIVVSALKKQIETKKKTLETAIEQSKVLRTKYDADSKKAQDEYDKAIKVWETAVGEVAQGLVITKDNSSISDRGYRYQEHDVTVSITVPFKKLPKRPERKDVKWEDYNVEIPTYYDGYNRAIYTNAVIAHWTKALEMLEVLPTGTIEVAVKDFNFLTKF